MTTERIKRTRYFAVLKNRLVSEYLNFDSITGSQEDIWFLVKDEFKTFFEPHGGYSWRVSDYSIHFASGEHAYYSFNEWQIMEIDIKYVSSGRINYDILITDPENILRRISADFNLGRKHGDLNDQDVKLVIDSVDLFQSIAQYNNWSDYDLKMESDEIREENARLKLENEELKLELRTNKETLARIENKDA